MKWLMSLSSKGLHGLQDEHATRRHSWGVLERRPEKCFRSYYTDSTMLQTMMEIPLEKKARLDTGEPPVLRLSPALRRESYMLPLESCR